MAKQKLNIKFLAIFLSIAAVLLVAVTVVGLVIYRNDPIKHITTGDGYMANGKFDSASKSYFRAFGKDPYQTPDYRPIDKSIEAVQSIVPGSNVDAFDRQKLILTLFANKAIYAQNSAEREAAIRDQVIPIMRGMGIQTPIIATLINLQGLSNETRAILEGMILEVAWRNASRLSSNEWKTNRDDLEELIKLDPANIRNHYGLLRGDLEQSFEQSTESLQVTAATKPFDDQLAAAREAAGPAWEFEAIELERDIRIARIGLRDQDLKGRDVAPPDPQRIAALVQAIRLATADSLVEADRDRLELLQRIFISNAGLASSNSRDLELARACDIETRDGIIALSDAIYRIDPDDFRSIAKRFDVLLRVSKDEAEADRLALAEIMADGRYVEGSLTPAEIRLREKRSIRLAMAEDLIGRSRGAMGGLKNADGSFSSKVNLNEIYFRKMQTIARKMVLDAAIEDHQATRDQLAEENLSLALAEVESAFEAFKVEFDAENDPEISKAVLVVERLRGENLESRGRNAEARGAFAKAVTAYNQLVLNGVENEANLSLAEIDAAILSTLKTEQFGMVTGIKRRLADRYPEYWKEPGFLQSFANDLAKEGRLEEATKYAIQAQELAVERGDAESIASLEKLVSAIGAMGQVGSGAVLPGTEMLAEDSAARASGDLAERRRILNSILDRSPVDPSVHRRVRYQAIMRSIGIADAEGDQAGLRGLAEKLRELDPDDRTATMILESESASYLDRARTLARISIEQDVGSDYSPDELDVVIAGYLKDYLRVTSMVSGSGQEIPPEYKAERGAVVAEAKRLNDSILAIDDDMKSPAVLRYVIRRSLGLDQRDEEKARRWIDRLRVLEGETEFTIQSQLLLYQIAGERDKALDLAARACDEMGFGTAEVRFAYGLLLVLKNDRDGALRQWRLANELSPRDLRVAVALSDLLATNGETTQAIEVLRRTNLAIGSQDQNFRERWLAAEQTIGNSLIVINERRRVFEVDPGNVVNAIALAERLMGSRIDREDFTEEIKDRKTGEMISNPSYSEREWVKLNESEKSSLITVKGRERFDEADSVLRRLRAFDDTDPGVIIAISRFLRQAGDKPESDRELDDAVKRLAEMEDAPENRQGLIILEQGRNLWRDGSRVAAREKFQAASDAQAKDSAEITALTAEFLTSANEIGEAISYREELLARLKSAESSQRIIRLVARDLVSAYLAENELEKAEALIDEYVDPESSSYGEQVIIGRLEFAKAERMWKNAGDRQGALKQIEKTIAVADTAAAMVESQGGAPLLRADALQLQLTTMTDPDAAKDVLEEATQSYRRAIAFEQRNWETRLALVMFLVRNFEYESAVSELEEFISIRNDLPEASIILADLLDTRLEQSGQAMQVAQEALNRSPKNLLLIDLVAKLREKRKEYDKAAVLYQRAFQMTQQPSFLAREIRVRMNRIPPDARAVVELARANPGEFARDPAIAAAYATAVELLGVQKGRGLIQFQDVYSAFKAQTDEAIAKNSTDPSNLRRAQESQERVMELIAFWYPWLFGTQSGEGVNFMEKDAAALEDFIEQVSKGSPSLHDLLQLNRAWLLAGNESRAMQALERALELEHVSENGRYATYVRLGTILLNLEEPDCERALDIFGRSASLRPQDALVKNNLAYAILSCGRDLKKALALSLEAVEARPANSSFRDTLAGIYFAIGESLDESDQERTEYFRAAEQEFKLVLKIAPKNLDYRIRLARVFLALEQCGNAKSALKMAGDAGPTPKQQDEIDALTVKLADCERDR
mgnify:FL=1|jgi:hypothetical protein